MTDSPAVRTGPPSPAQPLFILAMDHRDSFGRTLFGVHGTTGRRAADAPARRPLTSPGGS